MSFKAFFDTHAGKATGAVYLAVLLIVWPPALAWLTAGVLLWYAAGQLKQAFAASEAEQRAAALEEIGHRTLMPVMEEQAA